MWYKTRVSEILNIRYPIIQGPFGGGYSSTELVSTVSNAGGLGSFGATELTPQQIVDTCTAIRSLTDKPFAINLWVSERDKNLSSYDEVAYEKLIKIFKPYFEELDVPIPPMPVVTTPRFEDQVPAVLDAKPPVFSFVFGIPSADILNECRKRNIKTLGTATTPDEAVALEKAGVDIVVASGFEAGGHRGSFLESAENSLTGTFSLIPRVVDKLKIPVVAAGGVADGRGIAAAMILGAGGVQIGTAFLACAESNATPLHKEKLFSPQATHTMLTKVFSGRLLRVMRNKLSEELKEYEKDFAPFPLQRFFVRTLHPKIVADNRHEYMAFLGGQSAPLLKHKDAATLFKALVEDTDRILKA
ncbi:MAG TPA: nitronate monooxygenase [Flavitalea sp.]|nr:nitronate monooxygenase [Flavitalea sp.]